MTALKIHGGKHYLAKEIVEMLPPRKSEAHPDGYINYVEPYFGGGSVLFANDPVGVSEVANDLNSALTNFWQVMQSPDLFAKFQRYIEATPFSEVEFKSTAIGVPIAGDEKQVAFAVNFFIRCRQSLAGRGKAFTGITKTRLRRGMNNEVSAWLTAIEGLPAVHARLKRVLILNRPAIDVIKKMDGPQTVFYLDPPYLHETRATTKEYGDFEMPDEAHAALLATLAKIKGKFMLSGYRSKLYDDAATANVWSRYDFELPNNAAGGKTKQRMTECVWRNY